MQNTRNVNKKMTLRTATGAENPYVKARKKRAIFILGCFAVLFAMVFFSLGRSHILQNNVSQQMSAESKHYDDLKDENQQLKTKVKQMGDQDYLEKVIRSKYLYTKKGETVYNLPNDAN